MLPFSFISISSLLTRNRVPISIAHRAPNLPTAWRIAAGRLNAEVRRALMMMVHVRVYPQRAHVVCRRRPDVVHRGVDGRTDAARDWLK